MNWGIWSDGEGSLLDGMVKKDFFTKVTPEQDLNPKGARLHFPGKGERVQRPPGVEESLDRELRMAGRPLCSMQTE